MNKEIKTKVEINKAYYPLIVRVSLISFGFDFILLITLLLTHNIDSWLLFLVIGMLAKIATFTWLAFASAYKWTSVYYFIDTDRSLLIKNEGLHFPKQTSYKLSNLNSVAINQGPIQKSLKYGDLFLTFTNVEGSKEILSITEIVDPENYKKYFDNYLN